MLRETRQHATAGLNKALPTQTADRDPSDGHYVSCVLLLRQALTRDVPSDQPPGRSAASQAYDVAMTPMARITDPRLTLQLFITGVPYTCGGDVVVVMLRLTSPECSAFIDDMKQ
jgi:hypothetical protein